MKFSLSCRLVFLLVLFTLSSRAETPPVVIDYFNEAGCADCARVKNQVMPDLEERFEGLFVVNNYDLGIMSNVVRLASYQEKLNIVSNKPVMMVVDYKYVFNGFEAINAGLIRQMDERLAERQEMSWRPPQAIAITNGAVESKVQRFTAFIVITAGFLDGLNPCAIASLVFLMSLLAVARIKGRGLILVGVSFCLASFVTYTALGFGLLRAMYLFSGFHRMRWVVDICMVAMLGGFALMSFWDACRYKSTGNPGDVTLQLPEGIKLRIHRIMRRGIECGDNRRHLQNEQNAGLNVGAILIGGAVIGVLVTALESVCTGQMYVPALIVMAKTGMAKAQWYLLLYNLMFIFPLVTVFILTYFGLRTRTLLDWSKKNVVVSKIFLGIFFLLLAVLVVWL